MSSLLPARGQLQTYSALTGSFSGFLASEYRDAMGALYERVPHGAVWALRFGQWFPPRTTGPKSQSNHEWGHERTIAETLGYDDIRAIHELVGWKATGRGLPLIYIGHSRIPIPKPAHLCDTREQALRIEATHQLAAEEGITLIEEEDIG